MKWRQRYRLPLLVLSIGILSSILLLWIGRISGRLVNDCDIVSAVKSAQIYAVMYHLRLEEALAGGKGGAEVSPILDRATRLVDATLKGGQTDYEWISEPFKRPDLRSSAETIKSLLIKFKTVGSERLRNPRNSQTGSSIELRFERIFQEILSKTKELENIVEAEEAANEAKYRRIFLGILCAWALIILTATISLWRVEEQRRFAEEKLLKANGQLLSQSVELTEHRERLAGLVEKRTDALIKTNELLRTEIIERKQIAAALKESENEIRRLSSDLIDSQETERRRISMELHDGLGQALNATKLHLRVIEKNLREDQSEIREGCEELLRYMDQIIEDVRRLSLDLSPSALEDLGLTSALEWLVSNLSKIPNVKVTSRIPEIDHLFYRNHWITIYRVIQEALANIEKHAGAENISLAIERRDGVVTFYVEDDGQGFKPKQVMTKGVHERGLGLTTMNERITMMGGTLDLWSREGKGTRISFTIPADKEEALTWTATGS